MKKWSWILGVFALIATVLLLINRENNFRHAVKAGNESLYYLNKAHHILEHDAEGYEYRREKLRSYEQNVMNAEGDLEISRLSGRGREEAQRRLDQARQLVRAEQARVDADEHSSSGEPGPYAKEAFQRSEELTAANTAYSAKVVRDFHIGYGVSVVWIAFGVCLVLAIRKA